MNDNLKLYTSQEVSDLLNIHVGTVRQFAREGKIKGVYLGQTLRFTEKSIAEYIDSLKDEQTFNKVKDAIVEISENKSK